MQRVLFALYLFLFQVLGAQASFTAGEVIVFGASFESDNNNSPSRIPSSVSITWPNRLAESLGITGTMYARPAATSSDMLNALRDEYLVNGPPITSGTIHILGTMSDISTWITTSGINQSLLDAHIANVKTMVRLLTDNGAKHIYVTDNLYTGRNPGIFYLAQSQPDPEAFFNLASNLVNGYVEVGQNQIFDAVADINPDVRILRYGEFLRHLENNLSRWGFAEDGYLLCFNDTRPGWECVGHPIFGQNGYAPDMRKLVFQDSVHPTARGHEVLAAFVTAVLRSDISAEAIPTISMYGLFLTILGIMLLATRQHTKLHSRS